MSCDLHDFQCDNDPLNTIKYQAIPKDVKLWSNLSFELKQKNVECELVDIEDVPIEENKFVLHLF